jgi:hypothetical protein
LARYKPAQKQSKSDDDGEAYYLKTEPDAVEGTYKYIYGWRTKGFQNCARISINDIK